MLPSSGYSPKEFWALGLHRVVACLASRIQAGALPARSTKFMEKKNKRLTQKEMSEEAKKRPDNFEEMSAEEQWEIDKELGILDWEGS